MSRFKDFFYDKNDIIVALLILGAAITIIYFRIGSIMHYPEVQAKEHAATRQTTTTTVTQTTTEATTQSTSETSETTTQATSAATRTITIPANATSRSVAIQLEEAGIISSARDFEDALVKYNLTGYIQTGTFKIPAGASTKQIIEIITKRKIT